MKAVLAGGLAELVQVLPRSLEGPASFALGGLLLATHERRVAFSNLERAFPGSSRDRRWRVAFASYRQTARALLEVLHGQRYGDDEIRERVALEGVEDLRVRVEEGRGVVMLTGHYGNWEWLARRIAIEGIPLAALYKKPKDPGLSARLRAVREASGFPYIDHEDARAALRWLRRGGALGIVMDQEPKRPEDGVVAPFFGRPTLTFAGPFRLARLTGAPAFTAFCRGGPGRYVGTIEPFELSEDPDPERAATADAAAFNARLEALIRASPEPWTWTYRRWKRIERTAAPAGTVPEA